MADTLTVGELCEAIEQAVRQAFPTEVWVSGAISGLNRSNAGHVYFDLVEPGALGDPAAAAVPVALFMSKRKIVNAILTRSGGAVRMTDGTEIRIRGEVRYWERTGRVQLLMSLIDPAYTLGRLAEDRERLLRQLAAEGLLTANRERALPLLPLRVAVVTSVGSAAHADFCDELARSGYRFEVTAVDSRVQGLEAVDSLVAALGRATALAPDVIALVRGGGARTDLVAFDHERVVRAIAGCAVPVITGIGHETDRAVCDEVAHRSAKTPTACARVLIDRVRDFDDRVETAASRLVALARSRLETAEDRLDHGARRAGRAGSVAVARRQTALRDTADRIGRATRIAAARAEDRLTTAHRRLHAAAPAQLARAEHPLELARARLRGLDPSEALRRGWSITRTATGTLVTDPSQVVPGDRLRSTLAGGTLSSIVEEETSP